MIEEAKENRVTMAASDHTLMGKRVFTGTPNVKLIIVISLSCALIEQRRSEAVVPEASIKNLRPFSCFVTRWLVQKTDCGAFTASGSRSQDPSLQLD
jgi:hypothetical protein